MRFIITWFTVGAVALLLAACATPGWRPHQAAIGCQNHDTCDFQGGNPNSNN